MKSIAPGNEIAIQFEVPAVFLVVQNGTGGVDARQVYRIHFEVNRSLCRQAGIDQIFDDFPLAVDPD